MRITHTHTHTHTCTHTHAPLFITKHHVNKSSTRSGFCQIQRSLFLFFSKTLIHWWASGISWLTHASNNVDNTGIYNSCQPFECGCRLIQMMFDEEFLLQLTNSVPFLLTNILWVPCSQWNQCTMENAWLPYCETGLKTSSLNTLLHRAFIRIILLKQLAEVKVMKLKGLATQNYLAVPISSMSGRKLNARIN